MSEPAGGTVFLDGRPARQSKATPTTLSLRPRTYRVEVRLEGYEPATKQVRISPGERHRVELSLTPLPGRLEVTSSPSDATIVIDGREHLDGTRTPATVELEPGDHIIELRLEGYESLSQEIAIDPGGQHEIVVGLIPVAQPEPDRANATSVEPQPTAVEPQDLPSPERERRWRGWPWVVLGAGLGIGATGGVLDIVSFAQSRRTEPTQSIDDYHRWQDLVRETALAGDILLWTGVAIAAGGLIWLLLSRRRERQRREVALEPRGRSVRSVDMLALGLGTQ